MDKIAERLLYQKNVGQLFMLVQSLIIEKVQIVSSKILRVLLATLSREGLEAEHHSVSIYEILSFIV